MAQPNKFADQDLGVNPEYKDKLMEVRYPKTLRLVMIHGTWSSGKRWVRPGTKFHKGLSAMLIRRGYNLEKKHVEIKWNGLNRWAARRHAKKEMDEQLTTLHQDATTTKMLIIGHSHGGNIATESVRNRMGMLEKHQILGVICMNTPFLLQEVRSYANHLKFWSLVSLIIFSTSLIAMYFYPEWANEPLSFPLLPDFMNRIGPREASWASGFLAVLLILMFLLGRTIQSQKEKKNKEENDSPEVLCLSCPDDEAISALGLGEGLANLAQFLLHPMLLTICILSALFVTTQATLYGEGFELSYFLENLFNRLRSQFVTWTLIAITVGSFASVLLVVLFGLGWKEIIHSLVARILVSYVPLPSSHAVFRAINEVPIRWYNPFELFHTSIYNSKQTIDEIEKWLVEVEKGPWKR